MVGRMGFGGPVEEAAGQGHGSPTGDDPSSGRGQRGTSWQGREVPSGMKARSTLFQPLESAVGRRGRTRPAGPEAGSKPRAVRCAQVQGLVARTARATRRRDPVKNTASSVRERRRAGGGARRREESARFQEGTRRRAARGRDAGQETAEGRLKDETTDRDGGAHGFPRRRRGGRGRQGAAGGV